MKDDSALQQLREAAWRRPLSDAEQADLQRRLAADPEAAADWALEAGLSRTLAALPAPEISSNFTARVLAELERDAAQSARPPRPAGAASFLRRWFPRLAMASFAVGLSVIGFRQYEASARQRLAESVSVLAPMAALPSPDVLADFDAIQRLDAAPVADVELIALFQ